jgi:parallel beta-helix repeat protein
MVTRDVTLRAALLGCPGDGLVVGALGVRINLNGFTISGSKAPGSVGIRNVGHDGLTIEGGAAFATIQEFEVGVLIADAARATVTGVATRSVLFGIRLERADRATLRRNDVGFFEGGPALNACAATAPAGILVQESDHAVVRDNLSQLTGFGILLIRSHDNLIKGNGAAPARSDGNDCTGIALLDSDGNRVIGNTTTENRSGYSGAGDGIMVDSLSRGTALRENVATTNTDDGIDVDSASTKLFDNRAERNGDLGIESVAGVTFSGNAARDNLNPLQCLNVACL